MRMQAVARTVPTVISIVFPEELLSGDGDADGDEDAASDDEVIADEEIAAGDEELVVPEDSVGKNAVAIPVALDGLADTMFPFNKKTPFL